MELPSPTFAITATDTKDKEQFPNNDNMDRQIFHRFKENPIMVPSDIAPSAPGLKIECLLNPGVFRFRGRTCMLLRVAERPEQEPGSVSFPVYNDRAGKVEIMSIPRNSPDLKDDDARVIEYRGQNYLTTRSHLRLVFSDDGINFHEDPQYPPIMGYSAYTAYSIEDCRVTKIGDTYYLTYSAVSPMGVGVGMSSTEDWKTVTDHGLIFPPHNKDCAVFPEKVDGKYYAFHRPSSPEIGGNYLWTAASEDLVHWGEHKCIAMTRPGMFDSARLGAGAAPIRTPEGWLEIYHGATEKNRYCLGALLLDIDDPSKVLARSETPLMEPEAPYEKTGFFGDVIFTNGQTVDGDRLVIYYGAADEVICAAEASVRDILDSLK